MAEVASPPRTRDLLARYAAEWEAAVRHPFLEGVRTGALPESAFTAWLVQDHHFADGLFAAQARYLAAARPADRPAILCGLVALREELEWFRDHLAARRLAADAPLHPVCRAYVDYLHALAFQPYVVGITALWAVEQAYLDAWSGARPGAPPYRKYVEHWTAPEFAAYVEGLAAAADGALARAGAAERDTAAAAFCQVARYERDFWQMTLGAT